MKEHGICAKCKKSVGCPYADDRITGCKNFVLEPELKLTSKEWIRQCNTEQLARWIAEEKLCRGYFIFPSMEEAIQDALEWLKQPHKEE